MGRRNKYTMEEKIAAINDYFEGKKSIKEICFEIGCCKTVFSTWVNKFRRFGESVFYDKPRNQSYSNEFKIHVVQEYLTGGGSFESLALKHNIPSHQTIINWVSLYNCHKELKDYSPKGEVYMAQSRKTTLQERIEIVNYCLENDKQYKLAAEKFKVSYTQVYQWVSKFIEQGEDGLLDQRGKRKQENQLSDIEKMQREVNRLKHQLEMKERENILLKKVKEIEGRLYSQEINKKRNT